MQTDLMELDGTAIRSWRIGWLTLISAVLVLVGLGYEFHHLQLLREEEAQKEQAIRQMQETISKLQSEITRLEKTDAYLLDFIDEVSNQENVHLIDQGVDWSTVKQALLTMPAGDRKRAIMAALLYAWKDIPFTMGGNSLAGGLDSSSFLALTLSHAGLRFNKVPTEPLSVAMMRGLVKEDKPVPGDLVFYRGLPGDGNFGLMIIALSRSSPIGIGTLQKSAPLRVMRLDQVNVPSFPLVGYFHVKYPDE